MFSGCSKSSSFACEMTSINFKNLIGWIDTRKGFQITGNGETCIYEGTCNFVCSKGH